MSLSEFQRAFADLIASPARCVLTRDGTESLRENYELTPREVRRLLAMVRDAGMSINCTLYRVNRLTPIYSALPLTCKLLGDRLSAELDRFWQEARDATLQYGREAWRFAHYLQERIASGSLQPGPVEDAICFELGAYEVRTAATKVGEGVASPDSRKRLIQVRYDPDLLLDLESDNRLLTPLEQPVWLLLDGAGDGLRVTRIDGAL